MTHRDQLKSIGAPLLIGALVVYSACAGENQAAQDLGSRGAITKGGDDRTGEYEAVENCSIS